MSKEPDCSGYAGPMIEPSYQRPRLPLTTPYCYQGDGVFIWWCELAQYRIELKKVLISEVHLADEFALFLVYGFGLLLMFVVDLNHEQPTLKELSFTIYAVILQFASSTPSAPKPKTPIDCFKPNLSPFLSSLRKLLLPPGSTLDHNERDIKVDGTSDEQAADIYHLLACT
ncbi:hypothetical protein AM587_10003197 [Phytophthora nicotianae]|uniref:Uncharacterized protein n=1 Tax=Phytophthora nicotianae TaxID=4792 RepID=A0A0W8CAA6_PHYNI|nr:hypothetical protein AM587_10003197 [Phytophthora nicotianae]